MVVVLILILWINKKTSDDGKEKEENKEEEGSSIDKKTKKKKKTIEELKLKNKEDSFVIMWECACGVSCRESQRQFHLSECRMFIRSWRAAFRGVVDALQSQRQLVELKRGRPFNNNDYTLERRYEMLEKAIRLHASKTATIVIENGIPKQQVDEWWNKGMLLAALVESKGDSKRAGMKLIGSGKYDLKGSKLYRQEMMFVAKTIGIENLFAEHNEERLLQHRVGGIPMLHDATEIQPSS
jgi:hypothetical protein